MNLDKKQIAIGTAVFVIATAGLLAIGAYTGALWNSEGVSVTENTAIEQPAATDKSVASAAPGSPQPVESPQPAQSHEPTQADLANMINMGE